MKRFELLYHGCVVFRLFLYRWFVEFRFFHCVYRFIVNTRCVSLLSCVTSFVFRFSLPVSGDYQSCVTCARSGGDCSSSPDQLVVRDGDDKQQSPVLTVLCGTRNGKTATSTGETLSVELVTDAARQRQGFAATFSFVDSTSITIPPDGVGNRRPSATTPAAGATGSHGGGVVELGGWSPLTSDSGQINVLGTVSLFRSSILSLFYHHQLKSVEKEEIKRT